MAYGLDVPSRAKVGPSQHVAAQRLIKFVSWRAHVCKKRFTAETTKALVKLMLLFPLALQGKRHSLHPPPFEHLSQVMMQPETLKMATLIVDCFHPFNFGVTAPMMDSRTLLALFLIAVHPQEVLGSDFEEKEESRLLARSSQNLLIRLKKMESLIIRSNTI